MGVEYFPRASGRKQNWHFYHQHTSTTCWVNLRRLRKSGKNGHWWSCEKRQPQSPWEAFHSYLWEGRKDAPSSLNPTECNSKGGKDASLFCGLRGPYRRFLGLNYLASTSTKNVTHSGSNSCEVDPRGPVVGAQEEADYSHVVHTGDRVTEEASWDTSTELKVFMPATQIASTIRLVSQRNSIANKRCLKSRRVCFFPTSIPPLFYHEGVLPSISREKESFESALKF